MGSSLRQWRRSSLAVAAAGLVLAGCTVDDGAATAPTAAALTTDQALHDQLPQAVKDSGVLRFAGDSHPPYRTVGPDGKLRTGHWPDTSPGTLNRLAAAGDGTRGRYLSYTPERFNRQYPAGH